MLPLVGSVGVHDATPVGPVTCVLQVVTTCVEEFVPGVQVFGATAVVVGVVTQEVVTKLASVPGVQEATEVGPVLFDEQVTVAQPFPALALAGEQLAAGVGPLVCVAQVVEV